MTDARWLVRHHVEPLSFYAWQVLAGLVTLAGAHEIDLEFTHRTPAGLPPTRAVPWAEVTDRETATTRQVCFDLADGARLTGNRTDMADVVFKRTLTDQTVADGPRAVVLPYGLNYSCRSGAEGRLLRYSPAGVASTVYHLRHRRSRLTLARVAWPVVGPVRLYRADRHPEVVQRGIPRLVSDFEVPPSEPARAEVLFQTRAWPENVEGVADHHTPANFQRAAVIRALRRRLGAHFRGGFIPTAYSRRHFGDCLSDQPSDPLSFLQASRRVAIMVSTDGLRGSVPYKVPEFLAGSRAIVSEAIPARLPAPLEPGTHLESFTDPEQCADRCEQLLDDPDRVQALRQHAWDYYCDQVRPDALIRNRLADLATLG